MLTKKLCMLSLSAMLMFLFACGDDSSSNPSSSDGKEDHSSTEGSDDTDGKSSDSKKSSSSEKESGGTVYYPSNKSGSATKTLYSNWIDKFYVEYGDEVTAKDEQYMEESDLPLLRKSARIKFDQPEYTVSEGIGYGMLSAVFQDDETRYKKLMNYYLVFRVSERAEKHYMKWQVDGFMTGHGESASDADLDIAASLFIAYEKWGKSEYKDYGVKLAKSLYNDEVNKESMLFVPANAGPMLSTGKVYNISYFSLVAIKLFEKYDTSRSSKWSKVLESSIKYMQKVQKAGDGLWPDWSDIDGKPTDPQNGSSTGKMNDYFGLEGVRIPWRLVWYYSWYGDDRVKEMIETAAKYADEKTGGNVKMVLARYKYKGDSSGETIGVGSVAFKGAFCALSMIDEKYKSFLKDCNDALLNTALPNKTTYFAPSLQLLYAQLVNGVMKK